MLEVVVALEGAIAPMECFHPSPEGKVSCSHETDGDDACATKLLWTRVHGGVAKALSGTTLADLVEFAEGSRTSTAAGARKGVRQERSLRRRALGGGDQHDLGVRIG